MLSLLRSHVPTYGPPKNSDISTELEDGIFEFKREANRGPALRVLYFYEAGRIVVCTHGFWKTTQKTPQAEIKAAKKLRDQYLIDKRNRRIRIVEAKW